MRYLLRTNAGYEHLAEIRPHSFKACWERRFENGSLYSKFFLLVSAFYRAKIPFASSLTLSVMWAKLLLRVLLNCQYRIL